jgi:hypothetical protein
MSEANGSWAQALRDTHIYGVHFLRDHQEVAM